MHKPRILSRGEALLRDPGTGSSNLAAAPDVWHEVGPRFADEQFKVSALALTVAGPNLLSNLDGLGGAAALEVAVDLFDGYAMVRDIAAIVPLTIASGQDWRAGTHTRTRAFAEAGTLTDGSTRVGLRGLPVLLPVDSGADARWDSDPISLRYGRKVVALSWDMWLLRDVDAATVAPPRFELRAGNTGAGGAVNWGAYTTVASSVAEIEAGHISLGQALQGDVMQFRLTLPYAAPAAAAAPHETVMRTATVFSLCAWIGLDHSRWRFASLAELIDRSEIGRHEARAAWDGGDDVLILRIPLSVVLRGARQERIRVRIDAGGAIRLKHLEVYAVADLRFEPAER